MTTRPARVGCLAWRPVFEQAAKGLGIGDVWATDRYASKVKVLETLADGGSLVKPVTDATFAKYRA